MSSIMTKEDGLAEVTVTSDPNSARSSLCQILREIFYDPLCCSVSQHLRRLQGNSQSALGATQIMIGGINIFLGTILANNNASTWQLLEFWYPFWFGALFAAFGIVSILSEKFPSPCLVIVSVMANLAGGAFAVAAIVLYRLNFVRAGLRRCYRERTEYWHGKFIERPAGPMTLSVEENIMLDKCLELEEMVRVLVQSITVVLIIMSILELCVVISSAVLSIKSLMRDGKEVNKSTNEADHYKLPLLKEVATITA